LKKLVHLSKSSNDTCISRFRPIVEMAGDFLSPAFLGF
jgi:hypothetical protein